MQQISILGRVGADAEVKDLGNNQVINFSVAVTENYTQNGEKKQKTSWFEISRWGNNSDLAKYIKKGDNIFVAGKTNNRAYQDKNGEIQVVNGIVANEIQLLGSNNQD